MSQEQLTYEEFTELLSKFRVRNIEDFQVQSASVWMRIKFAGEMYHLEFGLNQDQVWFQKRDGHDWVDLYN